MQCSPSALGTCTRNIFSPVDFADNLSYGDRSWYAFELKPMAVLSRSLTLSNSAYFKIGKPFFIASSPVHNRFQTCTSRPHAVGSMSTRDPLIFLCRALHCWMDRVAVAHWQPLIFSGTSTQASFWSIFPDHVTATFWMCNDFATTAHTVKVITVHWGSVGCLQPTPSSENSSKARTLFHCSFSGLPAAHTFFWVIPQSPHLISPCLWVNPQSPHLISPFSQWDAIGPGFSQKNLVHIRIQSKKSCLLLNMLHKFCLRRNFFIKNLETVCLRLSVPLSKIRTRMGASLSSIRKNRN